ncbi:MAG: hypothetical protein OEY59_03775 [Deltaproteobacteria bacterium]|nr:hypothetical protein [Deltaproteobacteria bacterium]
MQIKSAFSFKTKPLEGFTFLEVLVAFSILALLLTVIIQSQADTIRFLEQTNKQDLIRRTAINELLKIEREYNQIPLKDEKGTFPDDHPLKGVQWNIILTAEEFMGVIPVKKVTYRITTKKNDQESYFEASIWGEDK